MEPDCFTPGYFHEFHDGSVCCICGYVARDCYGEGYFHDLEEWVCRECGYGVPEQDH